MQFGEFAAAERALVIADQPQQAVDAIFNAGCDVRHMSVFDRQ
ncbi:hypothetical protein QEP77_04250 [Serratia sp. B1]|nr:hypothetical protein QEP77_04250 [Serratia sp. B1]